MPVDAPPRPVADLRPVGARPPLAGYLAQAWRRRDFAVSLARFRIEAENARNRLGMGWVVLRPLLNAGVYGAVFGVVLADGRPDHFVEFLVVGVFVFEFFATSLSGGARSITGNAALVQSLAFPRIVLPVACVLQRLLQFVPMVAIMLLGVAALGHPVTVQWLLLVPLTVLLAVFNTGLALLVGRLSVHVRDLQQVLPFLIRIAFYSCGIFYSIPERFADSPSVLRIADAVPLHEFLTLARAVVLDGPAYTVPELYWVWASLWSLGILVAGTVFFWAAEDRYGRVS